MDLLRKLFNRQEKQVNTRGLFSSLLNNSAPDMTSVERLEAYKGWVYACVNAIAEDVATIDLKLMKRSGADWRQVDDHLALGPLITVNPLMSTDELWQWTQSYLELDGNAFWWLPKGQLVKKPIEIWPLNPTRMTVVKSDRNVVGGYVYKNEKGQDVPLRVDEIIHFKRFNPTNRYRGLGTVQAAALAIDTDTYSSQWNRNFFYNSAVPAATLETDKELTNEQFERLKNQWEYRYQGINNAHRTAILEAGLKFNQASLSQKDMEFLEQRRWTRDEILGIFRVPRTVLGITEDVNRANAEATDYVFAKRVVKPRMGFLTSRLSEFYLPLFGLNPAEWRFDFSDPVPQNTETELSIKKASLANLPWKTIDEVREEEGREPLPDKQGELILIPGTFKTIDQVLNPPEPMMTPMGGAPAPKPPTKTVTKSPAGDLVAGRIRFVKRRITKAHKQYRQIFADQQEQVVSRLRSKDGAKSIKTLIQHKEFDELERSNELVRFLFADWEDWVGVLVNPTRDALQDSLTEGGKAAFAQLDLDQTFDLLNPNVLDWLNSNALRHATSISDTTKDEVALRIMEGVEAGKGAEEIADSISEFFDEQSNWRALRVARSEVITGYAEGSMAGYRQSGIVKMKQWLTAGDANVDPECELNASQGAIPLEAPFASGHVAPIVHPNCRCVLQPVTGENV